ncbi:MAG: T9SS type A sorting domain-containing protein [Crocinitomicaceae bacterium]
MKAILFFFFLPCHLFSQASFVLNSDESIYSSPDSTFFVTKLGDSTHLVFRELKHDGTVLNADTLFFQYNRLIERYNIIRFKNSEKYLFTLFNSNNLGVQEGYKYLHYALYDRSTHQFTLHKIDSIYMQYAFNNTEYNDTSVLLLSQRQITTTTSWYYTLDVNSINLNLDKYLVSTPDSINDYYGVNKKFKMIDDTLFWETSFTDLMVIGNAGNSFQSANSTFYTVPNSYNTQIDMYNGFYDGQSIGKFMKLYNDPSLIGKWNFSRFDKYGNLLGAFEISPLNHPVSGNQIYITNAIVYQDTIIVVGETTNQNFEQERYVIFLDFQLNELCRVQFDFGLSGITATNSAFVTMINGIPYVAVTNATTKSYFEVASCSVISLVVAENKIINRSVVCSPNPFDNVLNVNFDDEFLGMGFEIVDVTGKTVISGIADVPKINIDTEVLQKGIYFIRLNGISKGKLVKN